MQTLRDELPLIVPQVQLALFGLGIMLLDFFIRDPRLKWLNGALAVAGLAFSGLALAKWWNTQARGFAGTIQWDGFFVYFSALFLLSALMVILLSMRYMDTEEEHRGEYYALILFAVVGMMFMASGVDLVVMFLGLETMALSFYVLAGFLRRDKRSNEGALKYLLLGAFSSGLLAYGFSILYGICGSTNIYDIQNEIALRPGGDLLVLLAFVTVSAGLLFKVAAVPFHQWAPDVYEGAPTTITAFLSVASKAASFALLLRIFLMPLWPARANWELVLGVIAVATMTIGNLAAITQTNVKRLLAYSSIAHAGYILLGLVAGNASGLKGVAFYLFAYTFMNTGAFAVVILLRRKGVIGDTIEDMNGLMHRSPAAAVLMLVFLLSLAGIPPTAGFVGKYFIFLGLVEAGQYAFAIFAVLYIVPAVYYYFRIVVAMWMTPATDPAPPAISQAQRFALAIAVVVTVFAGIFPEPFVRLAASSILTPLGR
jgi:NADH-quinone oxidoreductase subunit N